MLNKGFTLIELLVVMVILATLVGLGAVGVSKTMRGANNTKSSAFADTVKSAIMAYKNEKGEYPLPNENDPDSNGRVTYGTVSNNHSDNGNAALFMKLFGRNTAGKRDDTMRPYITDTSMLYVYKGKSARKLDQVLKSGSISANDQIGFLIQMDKTSSTKYKSLSQSRAFAPIKVSFDLELDYYSVSVPSDKNFDQVIELK